MRAWQLSKTLLSQHRELVWGREPERPRHRFSTEFGIPWAKLHPHSSPQPTWVQSHFSRVWLFATPWTVACQAPLSIGFSRQEYWSGLPYPPPGDLPDPGIKSMSLTSPALAAGFFTTSATRKALPPILKLVQVEFLWLAINEYWQILWCLLT